jgi:hypothetical protein
MSNDDRRFPPPWSVEEGETYFVVKDNDAQFDCYAHEKTRRKDCGEVNSKGLGAQPG